MTGGPHVTSLRVRFYELDPYAHVNHAVYIQYFEAARVEMLSEVGAGLQTLSERSVQLVVIGLRTRFIAPAGLGDQLMIETGVMEIGRARASWAQRISRGNDVLVTQIVQFAATDTSGRPIRVPDDLTEVVGRYQVPSDWLGKQAPK